MMNDSQGQRELVSKKNGGVVWSSVTSDTGIWERVEKGNTRTVPSNSDSLSNAVVVKLMMASQILYPVSGKEKKYSLYFILALDFKNSGAL